MVRAFDGVGYWAANAALFLSNGSLYPCCGRLTAALRGPNIIKLLCSFGANAGICWCVVCNPQGVVGLGMPSIRGLGESPTRG